MIDYVRHIYFAMLAASLIFNVAMRGGSLDVYRVWGKVCVKHKIECTDKFDPWLSRPDDMCSSFAVCVGNYDPR